VRLGKKEMTQRELEIGKAALRNLLDASGYGRWVGDDDVQRAAFAVIEAVDDYRKERDKK
jgi:hypothetical protein